jgi:hypothetical protein
VEDLQRVVDASALEGPDLNRARSALQDLRKESITQACVALVAGVTMPAYVKRSPGELVRTAYAMRSRVLHGEELPHDDARRIALDVSVLVSLLIAGERGSS